MAKPSDEAEREPPGDGVLRPIAEADAEELDHDVEDRSGGEGEEADETACR